MTEMLSPASLVAEPVSSAELLQRLMKASAAGEPAAVLHAIRCQIARQQSSKSPPPPTASAGVDSSEKEQTPPPPPSEGQDRPREPVSQS